MSKKTYTGQHYEQQLRSFHLCGYVQQKRIKPPIKSIVWWMGSSSPVLSSPEITEQKTYFDSAKNPNFVQPVGGQAPTLKDLNPQKLQTKSRLLN